MRSRIPIRHLRRVRDALLQPVSTERPQRHGAGAVQAADRPEHLALRYALLV